MNQEIMIQSEENNNKDTRENRFQKRGLWYERMKILWDGRRGSFPLLHFINFLAISVGIAVSRDRETCSLVIPLN